MKDNTKSKVRILVLMLVLIIILMLIIVKLNKTDESFDCSKAAACVLNIDGTYSCFNEEEKLEKANICKADQVSKKLISNDTNYEQVNIKYFSINQVIYFYEKNGDNSYFYDTKEIDEDEAVMTGIYTCKTNACYVYDIAGSYALLEDNGLFIYSINKDDKIKELEKDSSISVRRLVINNNGELIGIINGKKKSNKEVDQFYLLENNKLLIDYDSNVTIDYNKLVLDDGYLFIKDDSNSYLFDLNTGRVTYKNITSSILGIDSYYFYYEKDSKYRYIYDKNFKLIKEDVDTAYVSQDNYLVVSNGNKTYTYDKTGKQIS